MGIARTPPPVCLICAATYNNAYSAAEMHQLLARCFGEVKHQSPPFPFDYTHYYAEEMGDRLGKLFFSFEKLIHSEDVIDIKLTTNQLEHNHSQDGRRNINLDPGYIEASKLVLATTKNYDHRIHIGKGIYGDVHLRFRHGAFHPQEWTYPDYRRENTLEFFTTVRKWYLETILLSEEAENGK